MKRICFIVVLFFVGLLSSGCSTEFSPNAEWKEVIVVYGILDQDDDDSYIRIQKAFLGEGNMLDFAQVPDSNYYAKDVLTVELQEWTYSLNGNQYTPDNFTGKTISFEQVMFTDKPEGVFFNPNQPVYVAHTKGMVLGDKMYRLEIKNNVSGNKATADAYIIPDGVKLTSPRYLYFEGEKDPYMSVEWLTGDQASPLTRIYQPIFRFYYDEEIAGQSGQYVRKFLDIDMGIVRNTYQKSSINIFFTRSSFGSALQSAFTGQENINKLVADTSDIFILSGTEDLSNYINSSKPSLTLVQERPDYTNVENGLGIFTSRRRNYKESYRVDGSIKSYVKSLKIGF